MRGLTIVVAADDPVRFRTALTMAATAAALGAATRLFLEGEAVRLLAAASTTTDHDGLPTTDELIETCLDLEVEIGLCQSGLALTGMTASDPRFTAGGMTGLLARLGEDRLVVV